MADSIEPSDTSQSDGLNKNQINVAIPDLTSITSGNATNEEFVQKLIEAQSDASLIPWEECWLPSKGLYYGDWADGMVKVRAMGQHDESILANQRLIQSGAVIDKLFSSCCQFQGNGFDPKDLLLGDRIFLLYYLRGITHGNMYEFAITCPNTNCGTVSTHSYDLNELASTITWAKPELGAEPFRVDLPYLTNATGRPVYVGVRFLRAADGNAILAQRKARQKLVARPGDSVRTNNRSKKESSKTTSSQLDDSISQNLERIVVDVMGVRDLFTIRKFVNSLHAQDTAAIREWLREHTPGIDNTVAVTCPDCNHEFTVELPITDGFFRPSKQ